MGTFNDLLAAMANGAETLAHKSEQMRIKSEVYLEKVKLECENAEKEQLSKIVAYRIAESVQKDKVINPISDAKILAILGLGKGE